MEDKAKKPNGREVKKISNIDVEQLRSRSTEDLYAMYHEIFAPVGDEEEDAFSEADLEDVALMEAISTILDERNPGSVPAFDDSKAHKAFRRAYMDSPNSQEHRDAPKGKVVKIRFRWAMTAAVLLIVLSVGTAGAIRMWRYSVIQSGDKMYTQNNTASNAGANDTGGAVIDNWEDALDVMGGSFMLPGWLPEGYEFTSFDYGDNGLLKVVNLLYEKDDMGICYVITKGDLSNFVIEKDEAEAEVAVIDDIEFYIYSNNDNNNILWIIDDVQYNVFSRLSFEELYEIIYNLVER